MGRVQVGDSQIMFAVIVPTFVLGSHSQSGLPSSSFELQVLIGEAEIYSYGTLRTVG